MTSGRRRRYWAVERMASLSVRWPRAVIFAYAIFLLVSLIGVAALRDEEDLLVFLPTGDSDVQLFQDVSRRFGSVRVALIGVQAPTGDDIFAPQTLARVDMATRELRNTHGVDRVISLTSVEDLIASPTGVDVEMLVPRPPRDAEERAELTRRVLSRPAVAGQLVSVDGRALLIMVYLAPGVGTTTLARELRSVAHRELDPLALYFGGAPFAGDVIYGEARRDMTWLSPVAVLVLFLVIVLSFRDWVGVLLTVTCIGIATFSVLGCMGAIGERFTVATATLPVILFAAGSAFPVHVLGRYYLARRKHDSSAAVLRSVSEVALPLTIDTATTSIGLLAFVVMDIAPMRSFGIACGVGIWMVWLSSLTLVPAVLVRWPRSSPPRGQLEWLGRGLFRVWRWSERNAIVLSVLGLLAVAGSLVVATEVEVRMEPRAFYRTGSEPWRAEAFLQETFGGAEFVQVEVRGDLDEPATLRVIDKLASFARQQPGVTRVESILDPLLIVSEGMGLGGRLPETRQQAANLFFFLAGQAGMDALVTPDHTAALVHARVHGEARAVAEALEGWVARTLPGSTGVTARVAGEPVLDRGFSRAVRRNQLRATALAIGMTLVFLTLLFRSVRSALIAWFPAQLTMGILFGAMSLWGRPIDLGTAIVTGTAIGVGADFAMYYLWCLRSQTPEQVSEEVGPVALVAVLIIAAGFAVLALGQSPITRLFGVLSAASTVLSAVLTCVWLPALRSFSVRHRPPGQGRAA